MIDNTDKIKRFTFRIDDDLFNQVSKLANKNHRSVNSEIIAIIEEFFKINSDLN